MELYYLLNYICLNIHKITTTLFFSQTIFVKNYQMITQFCCTENYGEIKKKLDKTKWEFKYSFQYFRVNIMFLRKNTELLYRNLN
jgi:hypothetical protein